MSQSISISRRQFILGAGALSILGTTYTTYKQIGEYPKKPEDILFLSDKEYAFFQSIGNILIPIGGNYSGSGGDEISMRKLDSMFANIPDGKRELLGALPLVLNMEPSFISLVVLVLLNYLLTNKHPIYDEMGKFHSANLT